MKEVNSTGRVSQHEASAQLLIVPIKAKFSKVPSLSEADCPSTLVKPALFPQAVF